MDNRYIQMYRLFSFLLLLPFRIELEDFEFSNFIDEFSFEYLLKIAPFQIEKFIRNTLL